MPFFGCPAIEVLHAFRRMSLSAERSPLHPKVEWPTRSATPAVEAEPDAVFLSRGLGQWPASSIKSRTQLAGQSAGRRAISRACGRPFAGSVAACVSKCRQQQVGMALPMSGRGRAVQDIHESRARSQRAHPCAVQAGPDTGLAFSALQSLQANIAGVIWSTWMITSAGMSFRRAAFLIASALSAS